jgi:hypothetical protein
MDMLKRLAIQNRWLFTGSMRQRMVSVEGVKLLFYCYHDVLLS